MTLSKVLLAALCAAAVVPSMAANVQYTKGSVAVNAQPTEGYIGRIAAAAPVTVLQKKNQWAATLPVRGGRTGHTRRGPNEVMFRYLQEHARQ